MSQADQSNRFLPSVGIDFGFESGSQARPNYSVVPWTRGADFKGPLNTLPQCVVLQDYSEPPRTDRTELETLLHSMETAGSSLKKRKVGGTVGSCSKDIHLGMLPVHDAFPSRRQREGARLTLTSARHPHGWVKKNWLV